MSGVRRVYVPADTSAVAVGADEVALAIAAVAAERRLAIEIVRTGSRGMAWLEPLVELETAQGRLGFGPIEVADVRSLFDTALQHREGGARLLHHKAVGLVEAYPWLARQTRLTFARCGSWIRARLRITAPMEVCAVSTGPWRSGPPQPSRRSSDPASGAVAGPDFRPD